MSFRSLLDTNIGSQVVRHPRGEIAERIERFGQDLVATSIVVAAELRFGAQKKGSAKLTFQTETVLGGLPVLALELPADEVYADIRVALEAAGTPIGANDLLIGAQALALGLIVVTDNVGEFSRIPGLVVENWLR